MSRFGQDYGSFQISTNNTAYPLGLLQMLTGSAQQTLDVFKQQTVGSQAKFNMKNTMSDRHIVQKIRKARPLLKLNRSILLEMKSKYSIPCSSLAVTDDVLRY